VEKLKLETKIKRQGYLLSKIDKGKEIRMNPERVTLYEKGQYTGWLLMTEFKSLKRQGAFSLKQLKKPIVQDAFRVTLRPTLFEKTVTVRIKQLDGTIEPMKKVVTIITYTRDQRQYVYDQFKRGWIPLEIPASREKHLNVDLRKAFTRVGIKVSRLERPSP
jgi:hypothetical protein